MENFSPDDCFDEMAKVLMPDREPSEVGYIELLEEVKKLKEDENQCWKAIAKNKTEILMKYLPDYNPLFYPGSDSENIEGCLKKLLDENKKLKEEIQHKNEKFAEWCVENKKLKEENKELEAYYKNEIKKLKEDNDRLEQYHKWNKSAVLQLNDAKAEIKKLQKKAKQVSEIKDFLKYCDRNDDGHYQHYETRQLAIRVEGELKSLVEAKSE